MSNDPTPEGWTDEQWDEYLDAVYDVSDDDVEIVAMDTVDVPEVQSDDQGGSVA